MFGLSLNGCNANLTWSRHTIHDIIKVPLHTLLYQALLSLEIINAACADVELVQNDHLPLLCSRTCSIYYYAFKLSMWQFLREN